LNLPNSRGAFSNSLKDLATRRFGATLLFPFLTQIVEESAVRRHDNTIESDPGGVLVVLGGEVSILLLEGFGLGTIEASLNRGKIKARTCGALLGGRFEGRLAFRSFEALVEREMLHWVGVVGNGTLLPRVSFAFFFAVLAGNSTVSSHLSVTIGDKGEVHDSLNTFSSPSLLEVLGYELLAAGSQGFGAYFHADGCLCGTDSGQEEDRSKSHHV